MAERSDKEILLKINLTTMPNKFNENDSKNRNCH